MDQNASLDVELILFIIPVCLESDWDTIPSLWVDVAKSISSNFNNSLGEHVWFLLQMDMVLVWVVETSYSNPCDWVL